MAQGTGRIVDFTKPAPPQDEVEVKVARPQQEPLQRLSSVTGVQEGVEVVHHENVIVESDKIRSTVHRPGDPEIRIRDGDPKKDVSRDDD
jgi:hypothetical protein